MPETFHPSDYQLRPIQWLYERREAALFLSPGLGKTPITLTALTQLDMDGETGGALVVAPIRVNKITWPKEVAKWRHTAHMQIADMRTEEGEKRWLNGDFDLALINSEKLATIKQTVKCPVCKGNDCGMPPCKCKGKGCDRCEDGIFCTNGTITKRYPQFVEKFLKGNKEIPASKLVIDELSLAKSHDGSRFRALRSFSHLFKWKWGLTGTPAPNGYIDLFNQVRMLDDGKRLGTTVTGYRQAYFTADYMGYKFTIDPGAKEKIDAKLSDLALTMLGEDYLDVPTCNYEDVEVKLPAKAMTAYRTLEKELLVLLDGGEIEALSAAALSNKLLQFTCGLAYDDQQEVHAVHDEKVKALRALRKRHKNEPMLVLTAYRHEMDRLLKEFPEARKFHEKDLADWKKGKIKMWIANAASLSHGIDGLQESCRIGVWMTPTYSNEKYLQTNARLVRRGQSQETIIYRVVARDTIDEAVLLAVREKETEQSGLMTALKNLQMLKRP